MHEGPASTVDGLKGGQRETAVLRSRRNRSITKPTRTPFEDRLRVLEGRVHHTVDDRLEVLQADRRSNDRFVGEFGDGRTDFVGVDGSRVPVFFDALGNVPTRRALVPVSRSRMFRRCSGETVSATGIEQTDSQYHVSARAAAASASFDRPSEVR